MNTIKRLPGYLTVTPAGPNAIRVATRHGHLVIEHTQLLDVADALVDCDEQLSLIYKDHNDH